MFYSFKMDYKMPPLTSVVTLLDVNPGDRLTSEAVCVVGRL